MLRLDHVCHTYSVDTTLPVQALDDICLEIPRGQFIGLIGHTGSGKSTLVQHLNGLLRPTSGTILYDGEDIWGEHYDRKCLRAHVGLVFQYPEHQLFETDVYTDVGFGPKNLGLSKEEIDERVVEALTQVGLDEQYYRQSPFDLSGGQKRRAAIAGVLAMKPDVLVLDEPTAGLDPAGRTEILNLVTKIRVERGITVVLVSHSMEDVADYADRIVVMSKGRILYDDTPRAVFAHAEELEAVGLSIPEVGKVMRGLAKAGIPVDTDIITVDEAADEIIRALSGHRANAARK